MKKLAPPQQEQVFFIHFKFVPDFPEQGGDPIALFRDLCELGKLTVVPHTAAVPPLGEGNLKQLYLRWTVKLVTLEPLSHIEDILTPMIADIGNDIKIEPITLPPPEPSNQSISERKMFEPLSTVPEDVQELSPPILVKIGKNVFSIAHNVVLELLPFDIEPFIKNHEDLIEVKGETIALLRLHQLFRSQPDSENKNATSVVLVEQTKQKFGILVDEVIHWSFTTAKNVDESFDYLPGVNGAALLDNGELVFALDIPELIARNQNR